MSQQRNQRILVIDDNRAIHDDFRKILSAPQESNGLDSLEESLFGSKAPPSGRQDFHIDSAFQGEEGFELAKRAVEKGEPYALAFIDMRMPPGWDGLQTIARIWEVDADIQIVICSAYSDHSWDQILKTLGASDRLLILKKPFDTVEVCQVACAMTQKWELARQANLNVDQLRGMVQAKTRELELANQKLLTEVEQRKSSEERYRLAESGANDGLWDWDLGSNRVYYSPRWKSILGYLDAEISDSPEEWFGRVHADDVARFRSDQQQHLDGKNDQWRGEYRLIHKDGQPRWVLCRGVAVRDKAGKAQRAAGSLTDITDRKAAEDQLRFDALHDSLTGLGNRTQLTDRLNHCLTRARREPSFRFAILLMDLDHFNVINDSLGHRVGDQLLIEVGRRLVVDTRAVDMLVRPGPDHVARVGGDEFVLLLEGIGDDSNVLRIAERVHKAIALPFNLDGHEVCTFVSIGITVAHGGYERAEDILRDADTALYQAKAGGKACTKLFDPAMHERAMTRLRIESEIRQAIERNELVVYYQPILTAAGKLASLEALVRWQHPDGELFLPGKFIPIIEETGLIVPLGRWVATTACRQLCKWRVQFPCQDDLSVAVNVSTKQFMLPNLVDEFAGILADTGLPAKCLTLEITESAAMQNPDSTIQTLLKLREMGLDIDLDDFGTGYSSMSYLHRMPLHALKIDRTFVGPMCTDDMSRSIVQAITTLGHSLDLRVIAEGVESTQHLQSLWKIGCDFMQGFQISKPLPVEQATKFIAAHSQERLAASG